MFSGEGFPLTREERVRHGGGGTACEAGLLD